MNGGAGAVEYRGLAGLHGPLAFLEGVSGVSFHEHAELIGEDGIHRPGRVLSVSSARVVLEVFGGTQGLSLPQTRVAFRGEPLRMGVGEEMFGRVFDGLGRPRDGLPPPASSEERAVDGSAINPCRREYPRDFLETGISAIDGLNSLVLGQKLPIFTEAGLSHDRLALQVIRQARSPQVAEFAVVFVGLGLPRETAFRYLEDFRSTGAMSRLVAFLNLADDPPAERLIAPRCALTAAEYLAFDRGFHVLAVLTDVTNYAEALREVSSATGEVPSRKGYPGYLYSDLASIFERAGRIQGRPGSLTQLPIVTAPGGDLTHPVPDLTGYVTEGQIVLDRELDRRGIYPPVAVLPSLSRLMGDGIGAGRTREDHEPLARQLYAAAARAARARSLETIIGQEDLSYVERAYRDFGNRLERNFLAQGPDERRSIGETLDRGWNCLDALPVEELARIPSELLRRRRPDSGGKAA